jgi:hypothetical protein
MIDYVTYTCPCCRQVFGTISQISQISPLLAFIGFDVGIQTDAGPLMRDLELHIMSRYLSMEATTLV